MKTTRRTFLTTAAATTALPFLTAASYRRVAHANERLNMAVIGTGGMGTGHTRGLVDRKVKDTIDVIQVCDVYRRRLNNAMSIIDHGNDSGTMEYREVIDNPDVDAVLIATPDHWHTRIAIEAMETGKDVYCEKPLSHTIEQALECRDAVKRTGRTLQVGPQRTSDGRFWAAKDAIAAGQIGKVTWSQGGYSRNSRGGQFNWPIAADAGPNQDAASDGYVWWDRWLGHDLGLAPRIDWNADHFFRFRKYLAYNGGVATDLLYHLLAPLQLAIHGHSGQYPDRVVASGGTFIEKDDRDIADTFVMTIDYPSEHSITLASVMTNDLGLPTIIRGQHGQMTFDGAVTLTGQRAWEEEFRASNGLASGDDAPPMEVTLESPSRRDHMGNFLDAIRNGDQLACDVDLGCTTMVAIKMGVESLVQDRVMQWDHAAEAVKST